jgi:hypothetical protein
MIVSMLAACWLRPALIAVMTVVAAAAAAVVADRCWSRCRWRLCLRWSVIGRGHVPRRQVTNFTTHAHAADERPASSTTCPTPRQSMRQASEQRPRDLTDDRRRTSAATV